MKLNRFRNEFANNQVNLNQQLNDISWSVTSDKRKLCLGLESGEWERLLFVLCGGFQSSPPLAPARSYQKDMDMKTKDKISCVCLSTTRQLLFLSTITADKHLSNNQSIRDQRSKIRGVSVFCVSISVSLCSTFVLLLCAPVILCSSSTHSSSTVPTCACFGHLVGFFGFRCWAAAVW